MLWCWSALRRLFWLGQGEDLVPSIHQDRWCHKGWNMSCRAHKDKFWGMLHETFGLSSTTIGAHILNKHIFQVYWWMLDWLLIPKEREIELFLFFCWGERGGGAVKKRKQTGRINRLGSWLSSIFPNYDCCGINNLSTKIHRDSPWCSKIQTWEERGSLVFLAVLLMPTNKRQKPNVRKSSLHTRRES